MRAFWKHIAAAGLLSACLALTGCSFKPAASPEDLYALPQLLPEYTDLNQSISELVSGGLEYAAPVSGANTQSVQMVDLNGDGREEALAFLRSSAGEEKPLKIYIFSPAGDGYEQSALIEGSGTAIYSISYRDLDGDGVMELLVGWKAGTDLQALTVYTLRGGDPEELARSNYVKYAVTALDDTRPESEVVVLRADDEGDGVADFYTWDRDSGPGTLSRTSSARLSMTMAELNSGRVTSGTLMDGTPALFVSGVSDVGEEITDILVTVEGELTNAALSPVTGATTEIFRFLNLYPTDINGDGSTEVPEPTALLSYGTEPVYLVNWRGYDRTGRGKTVTWTYHSNDDGWYLELPAGWVEEIIVSRTQTAADEMTVTFSRRDGGKEDSEDLLRIYTITGDSRDIKASRGDRFVLGRKAETIYAAELLDADREWSRGITEDDLRGRFNLITTEWRANDN